MGRKAGMIMHITLHHRAPDTYYGQWPRFFGNEVAYRFAFHCPE
jgi:hypothetical protein